MLDKIEHAEKVIELKLAGHPADSVELCNLDEGSGASVRERVDNSLLAETEDRVVAAGTRIRDGGLDRIAACGTCSGCDFVGICRSDAPAG